MFVSLLFSLEVPGPFSQSYSVQCFMSDSESDGAAPIIQNVVSTSPTANRRAEQRKAAADRKRSLPKVFWAYNAASQTIFACVLASNCLPGQSTDNVSWELARVVVLAEQRKIDKSKVKYMSSAFELKGDVELECRLSMAAIGGTVNSHFTEYAASAWKAISFNSKACQIISGRVTGIVYVDTKKSVSTLLGVQVSDEPSEAAVLHESIAMHTEEHDDAQVLHLFPYV